MIQVTDTIEGSGFPLGFCVRRCGERPRIFGGATGQSVFRVDARALGGHQKEAIVNEGEQGPAWRLTSDEGPYLQGSDLAPFPLGFFNAGLQGDLLGRIRDFADARDIRLGTVTVELVNSYSFSGSFFKGDGRGNAEPAQIRVVIDSPVSPDKAAHLINAAVRASPALAAMRVPLTCTFALYVNGVRRAVSSAAPSAAPDAPDPLKISGGPPQPIADGKDLDGNIAKIPQPPVETKVMPSAGARVELQVLGKGRLVDPQGTAAMETSLKAPPGSHFGFRTDERTRNPQAPSGLALLSAGVSFCYLTQLLRYTEYLKYKVRAIRLVQYNPFELSAAGDGSLVGGAGPADTHLFLHGDEPDEVMQRLLVMGAQTCYLHAALRASLPPVVSAELNGSPLPLAG